MKEFFKVVGMIALVVLAYTALMMLEDGNTSSIHKVKYTRTV